MPMSKRIRGKKNGDVNVGSGSISLENKIKRYRYRKIKAVLDKEQQTDKEILEEDGLSVAVMLFILIISFAVGILLGYYLYRLAIDSSSYTAMINDLQFLL